MTAYKRQGTEHVSIKVNSMPHRSDGLIASINKNFPVMFDFNSNLKCYSRILSQYDEALLTASRAMPAGRQTERRTGKQTDRQIDRRQVAQRWQRTYTWRQAETLFEGFVDC